MSRKRLDIPVKDHLGNTFKSLSAMCLNYGLSTSVVRNRLKFKWSLQDALETPTGVKRNRVNII